MWAVCVCVTCVVGVGVCVTRVVGVCVCVLLVWLGWVCVRHLCCLGRCVPPAVMVGASVLVCAAVLLRR